MLTGFIPLQGRYPASLHRASREAVSITKCTEGARPRGPGERQPPRPTHTLLGGRVGCTPPLQR